MRATTDTAAYRRGRELHFRTRAAELLRRVESEPAVAGVMIGLLMAVALGPSLGERTLHARGVVLLPLVAGVIVAVGPLAPLGPARRGLSVQPTETLREE